MHILFIMDELKRLKPRYDSSLFLVKECYRRGHSTWFADTPDIFSETQDVFAQARPITPSRFPRESNPLKSGHAYRLGKACTQNLLEFDLILIRKEPPFDLNYVYMTYLLERVAPRVVISNHPRGIRNTNEKLGCLVFSKWMPKTLATSQIALIEDFQAALEKDIVLKPLDQKGGIGIQRIAWKSKQLSKILRQMTCGETRMIMAQEFIETGERARDKRITLLGGKVLWMFEKRAAKKNFLTNLDQGGEAFSTALTAQDEKLLDDIRPYLKSQGLHLVGLDVMGGKLIDLNVTCPGGFVEAIPLYPKQRLIAPWADSLEDQVSQFQKSLKSLRSRAHNQDKAERAQSLL
ncbi:MAG: hypothetical protein EXS63_04915 [Candidatus Omnitrophica bacterium]|nr:hypothetical protein [Candidatus Omnitrophota bacterium]